MGTPDRREKFRARVSGGRMSAIARVIAADEVYSGCAQIDHPLAPKGCAGLRTRLRYGRASGPSGAARDSPSAPRASLAIQSCTVATRGSASAPAEYTRQ